VSTERTAQRGLGSLGSGAVTAAGLAVQQVLAAVVGIVIAHEFGRTAVTDGFFAAYGVFVVLALAATASRSVLLPPFARARLARRLGSETAAFSVALAAVLVPLFVVVLLLRDPLGELLTGFGSDDAATTAARLLPWVILAAIGQFYAGVAASALAALDDYVVPAAGYALGSVTGLALILWRVEHDGIVAVGWGMTLNAAIAVGLPTVALARRARREAMPREAVRPGGAGRSGGPGARLLSLGAGIALPLALQAVYLICLPFAAREGVGAVTSFGYVYLAGSALVAVTASSLALVTSVPLTRVGLDPDRVARHVDAASWLALVGVGAAAGVVALAGEPIFRAVLGSAYGSDVGEELGGVLVALSPWMVVTVGVSVTFPLVFVAERAGAMPLLAVGVVAVTPPLAWVGQEAGGLYGLALALAAATGVGLVGMLAVLSSVGPSLRGLAGAAAIVAAYAVVAYLPPGLLLPAVAGAAAGIVLYTALLALVRPPGLVSSWRYLRGLA
jgi:hypothetical protein